MDASSPILSHLSPQGRALFLQYGSGETVACPFSCLHHAFEHYAAQQPDAIAVEHLGDSINYSQLDRSANALAIRLRARGVERGRRVCLLVQRSIAMVVGIMAILKAGAAYVPIDGLVCTDSTLAHVLSDSGSVLVLTLEEFRHRLPSDTPVLCLDDCVIRDAPADAPRLIDESIPSDSAYIIYTSGTTGQPKGVEVMHGGATNSVCLSPGNLGIRPGTRVAQLLNIAFDMAVWETFATLCNGGTLCIRGKTSVEWRALMKSVDVVVATPSLMVPHDPLHYPNIKTVVVGGEPVPQSLADAWSKNGQFFTSCGPTEISIFNTGRYHVCGTKVNIGRPTPNNFVYVLDDDLRPLPIGEVGMMWAGGAGVSKGYLNLPDKNEERYQPDPFRANGHMMFKTGDLGRWQEDGTLAHHGRADDQIKVKGFRVELDGVAAAVRSHPSVTHSTALLIDSHIWSFVTPRHVDKDVVLTAAGAIQPYYAVPTRFMALPSFPYTGNGKIDKRRLRELAAEQDLCNCSFDVTHIRKTIAAVKQAEIAPASSASRPGSRPSTPVDLPAVQLQDDFSSVGSDCSSADPSFPPTPLSVASPSPLDKSALVWDDSEEEHSYMQLDSQPPLLRIL